MSDRAYENQPALDRFVTLTYCNSDVEQVYKVFNDPDIISARRYSDNDGLGVEWSTSTTAVEALANFDEFIKEAKFKRGVILQRSTEVDGRFDRREYRLSRALKEIPNVDPERLHGFALFAGGVALRWNPQWPKTFHDIRTQEVSLALPEQSPLFRRALIQPIIAATAMTDLRASLDNTLDEFAEHFPQLSR